MAAEVLAQGGVGVTVYDAMPSAGRKFLLAGRGGLNLTHSEALPAFLARYGTATPQLKSAIEAFPPQALRGWSEALGQPKFVGSSGRVFPQTLQGLAAAARVAAAAGFNRRAVLAAPPLDRLGRRWTFVVCDARRTPRGRCPGDRAGARRRQLAAARVRRRMGASARRQRRDDIAAAASQLRVYRRLVRTLSRSLRGPAAERRCVFIWRTRVARRSRHDPHRH